MGLRKLRSVYRSFRVDGFRGHHSAEFAEFGVVNVLTGLNDAGKTSILEALFLHSSGPLAGAFAVQALRPGRRQDEIAVTPAGIDDPWAPLFHNFNVDGEIKLDATTSRGPQTVALTQDKGTDGQVAIGSKPITDNQQPRTSINVSVKTEKTLLPEQFRQSMIFHSSSTGTATNISLEFRLDPPQGEALWKAAIVKPGVLGADLAAVYSEMRKRSAGNALLEAIQKIDDRISHIEVLSENGRSQLHAEVNGQLIPFELLGDGPNAVAQYLVSMWAARDGVLLIDEVGSGVHYSVLETMWSSIYRAAKRMNVQVFATSHSQEALVAAHRVINDRQDALAVYRMRRSPSSEASTRVTRYAGATLASAIEANAELR